MQLVDLDKQRQGLRTAKRAAEKSNQGMNLNLSQQWVTLPGHVNVRFSTATALSWLGEGTPSGPRTNEPVLLCASHAACLTRQSIFEDAA
jgi:hypothetical protein